MAFIVHGPGVRDPISLERLFTEKVVNPTAPVERAHAVDEEEEGGGAPPHDEHRRETAAYRESESRPTPSVTYARQWMSAPVLVLQTNHRLQDAATLFRQRAVDYLPVVDTDHRPVGLLSEKDFFRALVEHTGADVADTPVMEVARQPVLSATPDTELRQVARIMFEQHIGAVPITGPDEALVGILTRHDLLRASAHNTSLELWA